ncbi:hypothetical protein RH831_01490 [Halodesulfurarchaeum sp. HSR-GB]|uniref:hypothetical protein n=1 Tax=Halodesulfurarchaeum sp. HSR-GB TaxID=3074077 RepID=UPI0028629918|nr:hypothetical protein [Halodesulfurarchaeum sp. HSR-GB]MDR5655856.1 hypothetical protein [Halodesulfurarchaeum sp. HSR-GB]
MTLDDSTTVDRRAFLTAATALGVSSLAGCSSISPAEDGKTSPLDEQRARELAEQFAPTLYFDAHEKWYPTDPRVYETEQDGEPIVDGFDAFDGYTERAKQSDSPPDPTVFYHGVTYEDSPLAVVQFWYYSTFDQFTTNFHWHDWEVLHVFVDTDTGEPQLYVASSHSGTVPNNEFLDPAPGRIPRILSELGSHSSALSVNDVADRFQRFSLEDTFADITNSSIEGLEDIINIPIAYGLPRDEGSRLPYVVPELDGEPIYDHDRLPSIEPEDLIADELTIRSFADLASPPGDLPGRATGTVFQYGETDRDEAVAYDLVPTSEVEHITDFTGPQLSFEFAIPDFADDTLASHITTAGVPWEQARYDDPAEDITEPNHRSTLADRYDVISQPPSINTVIAGITETVTSEDAPDDEGLTTQDLAVESVALLESEPEALPTFRGVAVARDVPSGDHRLTVNGPGVEPHSESVRVDDEASGPTTAGVEGEIPLVAREHSMKLEIDPEGADSELNAMAIEDDFAGRIYDAPLADRDGVYLHQGGAYTTEVRDTDDEIGAYRVNPTDQGRVRLSEPRTGKASLATYLADVARETSAAVGAIADEDSETDSEPGGGAENAIQGLARALEAVGEAAQRAADQARAGDRGRADESLRTVQERLGRVQTRLAEASDQLPADLENANERRLEQLNRRADQARESSKV